MQVFLLATSLNAGPQFDASAELTNENFAGPYILDLDHVKKVQNVYPVRQNMLGPEIKLNISLATQTDTRGGNG